MELKSSIIINEAAITAASNGCSIDGTTIKLGHTAAGSGLSNFTENRYLYVAGFALQIGGTAGANIFSVSGTTGSLTLAFDMYVSGIRAGIGSGSIATNTIFGKDALFSNTTGYTNTAIGYQTLYTNISGYDNTAIGYQALKVNRYGYRNTALGDGSAFNNRDGYGNTALGFYSLYGNNDGYFNTAIGYQALESNIDGYNNIAIGWQAGDYTISGTGNTNPTNCVYIGSSTKSYTDSETNEIVIGYNANGLGSNKAIYGNTSIVRHHLNGTPPATSQYGLLTIGSGAFDGATAGFYTGSASGTGLAMNLASGSTSDLMNLQVAGSNRFSIDNIGIVRTLTRFEILSYNTTLESNTLTLHAAGTLSGTIDGQLTLNSPAFTPSSGNTIYSGVSMKSSHNATGAASGAYKPVNITYTINNTGTASTATATGIFLNATETALNGMTHNLMDLQVGGSSRLRIDSTGEVQSANALIAGSDSGIKWASRSAMNSATDGNITLTNALGNDFGLLQFGGTSSSFPALKKSGASIEIKKADDSAYTNLYLKNTYSEKVIIGDNTTTLVQLSSSTDGILKLGNSGNSSFTRLILGTGTSDASLDVSSGVLSIKTGNGSSYLDLKVEDEAYGNSWNGNQEVPTKNAIYNKIETFNSGTYTPSTYNLTNITSISFTGHSNRYIKSGNFVVGFGSATIVITTNNLQTSIELSLPVSTTLSDGNAKISGNITSTEGINALTGMINSSNGRIQLFWGSGAALQAGTYTFVYSYMYEI